MMDTFRCLAFIFLMIVLPREGYSDDGIYDLPNTFTCIGGSTAAPVQIIGSALTVSDSEIPMTYEVWITSSENVAREAARSPSLRSEIDPAQFPLKFSVVDVSDSTLSLINVTGRRTTTFELPLFGGEPSVLNDATVYFFDLFDCVKEGSRY